MNLDDLWDRVLVGLERAIDGDHDEDDAGMRYADSADILQWCNDLEARVGLDVTVMRAAALAYIRARDARRRYDVGERVMFYNNGSESEATITECFGGSMYCVECDGEKWALVEAATMLRKMEAQA